MIDVDVADAPTSGTIFPSTIGPQQDRPSSRTEPILHVDAPLTDECREEAIQRAGRAMEAHYFRWCCTGNFADKGDADRARLLMEALIAGRSKAQVLRMEIRKGLI